MISTDNLSIDPL